MSVHPFIIIKQAMEYEKTTVKTPFPNDATTSFRRTGNHKPSSSKVRSSRIEHRCEFCGKTFYSSSCVTRFCSKQCNMKAYYESHKKKLAARTRTKRQALNELPPCHFPPRDSDLLTVNEFAHRLGVCKQTVYTLVSKGHVRLIRLSQRLSYISWSEFIDTHRGNTSGYSIPHDVHSGFSPAPGVAHTSNRIARPAAVSPPMAEVAKPRSSISKPGIQRIAPSIPADYISMQDAVRKYGLTTANISMKLTKYRIKKLKTGRNVYFSEPDFAKHLRRRITG